MSNCSHEAWDFGALQCPDCGAVKGHVADADYAKLEAEAQALREEVAALRARVAVVPDAANDRRKSAHYCRGWNACLDELARLNGKTVNEGLLRRLARPADRYDEVFTLDRHEAAEELRALLNQDKENGNG